MLESWGKVREVLAESMRVPRAENTTGDMFPRRTGSVYICFAIGC